MGIQSLAPVVLTVLIGVTAMVPSDRPGVVLLTLELLEAVCWIVHAPAAVDGEFDEHAEFLKGTVRGAGGACALGDHALSVLACHLGDEAVTDVFVCHEPLDNRSIGLLR